MADITVHVKNLEKYHPGYKDRKHIWAKIYFESFLDNIIQNLDEIDRYRFWSLIVFEVFLEGKPLVLTDQNLKMMSWNVKKRPVSLTLQMLHTLIEVCNGQNEKSVTQSRVEVDIDKSREIHCNKKKVFKSPTLEEIKNYIESKHYAVDPKKFYEYFTESGWVDSKGNKVRNWKQKIITWSGLRNEPKCPNKTKRDFDGQESSYGKSI